MVALNGNNWWQWWWWCDGIIGRVVVVGGGVGDNNNDDDGRDDPFSDCGSYVSLHYVPNETYTKLKICESGAIFTIYHSIKKYNWK